jgi:hypothetical protein
MDEKVLDEISRFDTPDHGRLKRRTVATVMPCDGVKVVP